MQYAKLMLIIICIALAGCAAKAEQEFAKLKVGMTPAEVKTALGAPLATHCIRFNGHDSDYLVWEYNMVPERGPVCPSEGAGRLITGMVTLGASEIAWSHASAEPHWVYFLHGMMVYYSPAFDCKNTQTCQLKAKASGGECAH